MMTPEKLREIIAQKEGNQVEFKRSKDNLSRSVYETICAFLNRCGGHVILGAEDNGRISGINPDKLQVQLDTLARETNNPQLLHPTVYLQYELVEIDGYKVIYFYVPESRQAHSYKGVYYDRNQDGDFALRSTEQIANLFIRKMKQKTEDTIVSKFIIDDLDAEAFNHLRSSIRSHTPNHPWVEASDEEILRSWEMILTDADTGKSGITLAALLLFGKEQAIRRFHPQYRIDVLCRMNDTMLYDDRLILECNLLSAYPQIMDFIAKHLPERPYIEGMQRFSLRDRILREVVLNMLIHREYSSFYPTTLTIYQHSIVAENWNIPYVYGHIDKSNTKPHRKNPVIANVFSQMGIVEELGSGMKKIFQYTPLFSNGGQPSVEEQDVYRIEIPYQSIMPKTTPKSKEKSKEKILRLMLGMPSISTVELAEKSGLSVSGVEKIIRHLKETGKIERVGSDKGGHWEVL